MESLRHSDSILIAAAPDALYDLVSDVTRTGEWSPVCRACWWDDERVGAQVGSWFTGRNETPTRTYETRSHIVVADRGREFAWVVGDSYVRWGFTMAAAGDRTRLSESWEFRPEGLAMFADNFGERAGAEIENRTAAAHAGIPATLAAIKRIAESE
jgi:hypothetical protein